MFTVSSDIKPVFYGTPTVYITEKAARYMKRLVEKVSIEVGWLMVCHERDDGDFVLSECIVPKQQCHAATTELLPEGLEEAAIKVMEEDTQKGVTDPGDERFRVNHLNAWFHSHASMGVSPSGQDDQQMVDFCQKYGDDHNVWVRGIVNKKGDIHVTIYYRFGKTWKVIKGCPVDILWEVSDDMAGEVDEVVSSHVKHMSHSSGSGKRGRNNYISPYAGGYYQQRVSGKQTVYPGRRRRRR